MYDVTIYHDGHEIDIVRCILRKLLAYTRRNPQWHLKVQITLGVTDHNRDRARVYLDQRLHKRFDYLID